jgi:hypothetical protein
MSTFDALSKGGAAALGIAREAVDAASPKIKSWLKTGAALGAARTGARVVSSVVRRNPGLAVAAAAVGAGYLAYSAYRKHAAAADAQASTQASANEPIDATATVIETRKRSAGSRRKTTTTAKSSPNTKKSAAAPRTRKPKADN